MTASSIKKRIILSILILLLIAAVAVSASLFLREKSYIAAALVVTFLSFFLFALGFEKRKIGSRRLVLVGIFTALSVLGRFIPVIKPVPALTIISGIFLGPEAGFLTGSMTAVLSNFFFGQGPWTPFQMLGWGLIGLFAGLLSRPLKKHTFSRVLFALLSGLLYSFLMDIWTVLWAYRDFSADVYVAALISAIPYTLSYCISNALFMLLLYPYFQRKLERILRKYGI